MQNQDHHLIELLLYELAFLKLGGYGKPWRNSWRPTMVFRDSPICLHKGGGEKCNSCALANLVPEDKRTEGTPCHHIPLNDQGDTVATLYETADQQKLDDVLRAWLESAINRLREEQKSSEQAADEHSKNKPAAASGE